MPVAGPGATPHFPPPPSPVALRAPASPASGRGATVAFVGRCALLVLNLIALAGCATTPVQPWERGRLARWDMRWDPDPLQAAMADHAHFSKEGSNGHVGAAGGGCGCN